MARHTFSCPKRIHLTSASRRSRILDQPRYRLLWLEPLEDRRMLAVVTVDTNLDTIDFNDGVTSLRELKPNRYIVSFTKWKSEARRLMMHKASSN
jgi:hypothetical protein